MDKNLALKIEQLKADLLNLYDMKKIFEILMCSRNPLN